MAGRTRSRHKLHARLEQVLGDDEAATLMSSLPLSALDLATKQDLARLERRMDGLEQRMDRLEQRMDRLEQRVDEAIRTFWIGGATLWVSGIALSFAAARFGG